MITNTNTKWNEKAIVH